jgi:hypothetical protein
MRAGLVPVAFVLAALLTVGIAATQQADPTADMLRAAEAFLDTLSPEQQQAVMFPFDTEDRFDWHYIPRERKGVALKTMTAAQKESALNLVRSGLSQEGFDKSQTIRELEQILFEREGRAIRDTELYFFMIFGEPSASDTWGWRYEGHHISQNWTIVNGEAIATTPQFFGTNPGHVRKGRMRGTRVLSAEEDHARSLLGSLSPSLRSAAIVSGEAPRDMLTSSDRQAAMQDNTGVSYSQLSSDQQRVLWVLIEEYANVQRDPVAKERLRKVRAAGLDDITFAWMGGSEVGEGHYYRVQGPTFLIEYDNVQNSANHVHSVWRDFNGDFGRDLLAAHYTEFSHQRADD